MATHVFTESGEARPRELTGRMVLIWLVAFFAVVAAVNAIMIDAAISTFAGLESDSPYQAGLGVRPGDCGRAGPGGVALAGGGQGGQIG